MERLFTSLHSWMRDSGLGTGLGQGDSTGFDYTGYTDRQKRDSRRAELKYVMYKMRANLVREPQYLTVPRKQCRPRHCTEEIPGEPGTMCAMRGFDSLRVAIIFSRTSQPGTHSRFRRQGWHTRYRHALHVNYRRATWMGCAQLVLSVVTSFVAPWCELLIPAVVCATCGLSVPMWVLGIVWWTLGTRLTVSYAVYAVRLARAYITYAMVVSMYVTAAATDFYIVPHVVFVYRVAEYLVTTWADWANTALGCLLSPVTALTTLCLGIMNCFTCILASATLSSRVYVRKALTHAHLRFVNVQMLADRTLDWLDVVQTLPDFISQLQTMLMRPCALLIRFCARWADKTVWASAMPFSYASEHGLNKFAGTAFAPSLTLSPS